MSDYMPTESLLIAAYAGLGESAEMVKTRHIAALKSLQAVKAKVWDVAYMQGRCDERTAQYVEQHPQDEYRLRTRRDTPYRKDN